MIIGTPYLANTVHRTASEIDKQPQTEKAYELTSIACDSSSCLPFSILLNFLFYFQLLVPWQYGMRIQTFFFYYLIKIYNL